MPNLYLHHSIYSNTNLLIYIYIYLTYFKINSCKLPSCNNAKKNVSLTYSETTFCKLPPCNVSRSCPLRRHLRNTCVPALLRFEHPVLVIYRRFTRSPWK